MGNDARYMVLLLDGDLDVRATMPVYSDDALWNEIADLLESWDAHMRDDNGALVLESAPANAVISGGVVAVSNRVYSNDGDSYALGQCLVVRVA